MVTEDGNETLGAVGGVVDVVFDDQACHGWYVVGCVVLALEAMIFCFVDPNVYVTIKEALILLLISSYQSFLIQIILVCYRRKVGRSVALEREGRYKRGTGLSL